MDERKRASERTRPMGLTPLPHKHIYRYILCALLVPGPVLQTFPYNMLFNTSREHFNGAFVPCDKVMQCVVFKIDLL